MCRHINLPKKILIKLYTGMVISHFTNKRCLADKLQTRKIFSAVMGEW